MQIRMLLRPSLFPFLRVRAVLPAQSRCGDLSHAKAQTRGQSTAAGKGRRFTA